ncbi:unnamed protein product [Protopolystoma xenopodis]|uniref:Uncharacterized protein n=1 Tax=Protopolystoma xenopodis TaxID=117903 RepID=A0A3S5CVA2_9PLAT|nr:unnamed protein product [Protopolystoma xenopodis]
MLRLHEFYRDDSTCERLVLSQLNYPRPTTCPCSTLILRSSIPMVGMSNFFKDKYIYMPPSLHFALRVLINKATFETSSEGKGSNCDLPSKGNWEANLAPASLAVLETWFEYLTEGRIRVDQDAHLLDPERPSFAGEETNPLAESQLIKCPTTSLDELPGCLACSPFYVVVTEPSPIAPSLKAQVAFSDDDFGRISRAWQTTVYNLVDSDHAVQLDLSTLSVPLSSSMATDEAYFSESNLEHVVDSIILAWQRRCCCGTLSDRLIQ